MAKIYIDGKMYEADADKNVLEACLSLGFDLPYFCWHPAMGSVGACRQCAVIKYKDENDKTGKLTMACMEPVQDNLRISLKAPDAAEFRGHVIEWLMTNHPHDCPVCDEGGECHLQDMTVMTGHNYRKFEYNKRTYRNQYLGPFINHEMNRCIQCYRCVRFYRDYAGGKDFDAFASRNHVYFGRKEDGVLENEFSGNLVEICPTGVFTDKTLKKHYTRKWDLTSAPSICNGCSLGCNIIAGERYGGLRRILSRYNGEVNGYFICDRGRFGYEYVNGENRIRQPFLRHENNLEPTDKATVLDKTGALFRENKNVIGIGSPRASLESNYSLMKLVGKENFYSGIPAVEQDLIENIVKILTEGPAYTPSLKQIENSDAVLILGEDITNTAPMMALSVRQAAKNSVKAKAASLKIPEWNDAAVREVMQSDRGPLFNLTVYKTKLDDIATKNIRSAPADIARLGFAIASLLNVNSPAPEGLTGEEKKLAKEIASALSKAENPLIISGTSNFNTDIINSAANVAWALCGLNKNCALSYVLPESNSMGIGLMGFQNLSDALNRINKTSADAVIILENDLYRRLTKAEADVFFNNVKEKIVIDFLENETVKKADMLIPAGTFAESDGTLVNNEGRAQRYYQVFEPGSSITESWKWIGNIMVTAGNGDITGWTGLKDYTDALIKDFPVFKDIENISPPPGFRIAGQKIPREPHRYSGRTAMNANKNVSEPKPPEDSDSPLTYTMEGYRGMPPSSIIPYFWSPGWNSVQSINKYQIEVGGPLHGGDPGKRIINPGSGSDIKFFPGSAGKFSKKDNEWFFVPVYSIFGSEELSSNSPGIQERIPEPSVYLCPADAEKLKLQKGDQIEFNSGDSKIKLGVKIIPDIPEGIAGYPFGFKGIPYINLNGWFNLNGAK